MSSIVNVVLVHGAWADGSCWSKEIPLLQAKGYHVSAAQIPLTSLEDDIAVTKRLLALQEGPTVLVGHSYGGAVISGAAVDALDVKALVYIAAFGLDEGESLDGLSKQGPPLLALRKYGLTTPGSSGSTPTDSIRPLQPMSKTQKRQLWRQCRSRSASRASQPSPGHPPGRNCPLGISSPRTIR
jgi:pimeloyl-ACP methyl ester carboxylesterase